MCCRHLLVKTCCSCCCRGVDLSDGAFAWAILDGFLHLALGPLASAASDVAPFAVYLIGWIVLIVLADIVLAIGCKVGLPAFLTGWMIVIGLNIILCVVLWVLIPVFFIVQANEGSWEPLQATPDEIWSHGWWAFLTITSLTIVVVMPFIHAYFWVVVKSLRRRMLMQIAVDFDPDRHNITHTELKVFEWIYGGRGGNGRPEP